MTRFGAILVSAVTLVAAAGTSLAFLSRHRVGAEPEVEAPPVADVPQVEPAHDAGGDRAVVEVAPELAAADSAPPGLIARLAGATGAAREELLTQLRRTPGPAAEVALIEEARAGAQPSTRTMAIDALAERRSDRALEALAGIARSDPELPARPLIAQPRDHDDPSTELPDEQTFTPRMQAMAALAETRDLRAVPTLVDLTRSGADESLRMEAARHLGTLRADPRAAEALRAATTDPSAYVRLSALHGLGTSADPTLLARIASQDRDAGVRTLAQQLLDRQRQ